MPVINSKTLTETEAGAKANIVPCPERIQPRLIVRSLEAANTVVKRCSMTMKKGPARGEDKAVEAKGRALEAEAITSQWTSATTAETEDGAAEGKVVTGRWVSAATAEAEVTTSRWVPAAGAETEDRAAEAKGAGLTVGTDTTGLNMAITGSINAPDRI